MLPDSILAKNRSPLLYFSKITMSSLGESENLRGAFSLTYDLKPLPKQYQSIQ